MDATNGAKRPPCLAKAVRCEVPCRIPNCVRPARNNPRSDGARWLIACAKLVGTTACLGGVVNGLLYGVALGVMLAATPFLQGCQTGAVRTTAATPYQMDANDKCLMQHTWDTTILGGYGIDGCARTPWYRERQVLDGVR